MSSLWGADADEDVGVPAEKFSPCLGLSERGLHRRRCGGNAVEIMPHFYRLSAQKWIDYLDSVVILAVVQVFRVKRGAPQFHSGRNDRGVPVRDLKPATDLHRGENQLEGDGQDRGRRGENSGH